MKKMPIAIRIISRVYVMVLAIFSLFRLIQFFLHFKEIEADQSIQLSEILSTFWFGFRYDLLASSYLLALPFLLLVLYDYKQNLRYKKISFELVFYLFLLSFMFAAADIPYYNKFYNRITVQAFEWFRDPITLFGMVFQEVRYWFIFIPFIFIVWQFRKRLSVMFDMQEEMPIPFKRFTYYVPFFVFIFFSSRGVITGAPLRQTDAFQGDHVFLNALKLNSVLTMTKSYEIETISSNNRIVLMNETKALGLTRQYFKTRNTVGESPVLRKLRFKEGKKKNVVLIIMESMAASKMQYFGNTENRTPFLDSLFRKGLSYTNLYSNGIHTYSGVFGVNYAQPMLFEEHPMTQLPFKSYSGLPAALKQQGYQTSFFIPGSGDFDNMYHFLKDNHYDTVYTKADYPEEEIVSIWGPADAYLFQFALQKINKLSQQEAPFLATVLTISDHGPYRVPESFVSESEDDRVKATQFADWSLKQFMKEAAKQDWFKNTVFVFVADHGETMGINYKIPLTYNHIPLTFYYKGIPPEINTEIASQLDVFPTLMGLLELDYRNNSFGIDLQKEHRKYTLFNHDKEFGVIGKEFLLIADKEKTFGLYKYRYKDKRNYAEQYPEIRQEMELFFKSHIQTYQYMLEHNLQE